MVSADGTNRRYGIMLLYPVQVVTIIRDEAKSSKLKMDLQVFIVTY